MSAGHRRTGASVTFILAAWASSAHAGDALPANLRACSSIVVDADRLACFDREVRALAETAPPVAAAASTASAQVAAAGVPAPAPTPEQKFGLEPGKLEQKYPSPAGSEPLQSITALVTRTETQRSGNVVIELDNGQAWMQKDTNVNLLLKPGTRITIERGAIGSYWMVANGRGAHVRRIR